MASTREVREDPLSEEYLKDIPDRASMAFDVFTQTSMCSIHGTYMTLLQQATEEDVREAILLGCKG